MMVSAQNFLLYVLPTMVLAGCAFIAFVSTCMIRWERYQDRRRRELKIDPPAQKDPEYHI